jgi:hypothetical protein
MTIGNGTIAKLGLPLEPDVALQWGAAFVRAAKSNDIEHPMAQSIWLACIMLETNGLSTGEAADATTIERRYEVANLYGYRWAHQGWRKPKDAALEKWHKLVSHAMGV